MPSKQDKEINQQKKEWLIAKSISRVVLIIGLIFFALAFQTEFVQINGKTLYFILLGIALLIVLAMFASLVIKYQSQQKDRKTK